MSQKVPVDGFEWTEKKIKKCHKVVCNRYDKKDYVAHIKIVKKALNCGLIF